MAVKTVQTRADVQEAFRKPWYGNQHQRWLSWLEAYDGPGGYGRSRWLRAAEFVYNHIVNPRMLMYVAEAVDIDRELLSAAADAALASRSTRSRSRAIRRIVPWRMIEGALIHDLRLPAQHGAARIPTGAALREGS